MDGDTRQENDDLLVVVGEFPPLLSRGLAAILHDGGAIRILARGLSAVDIERSAERYGLAVAILNESAEIALVRRLAAHQRPTAALVLADRPTHVFGTALLAAGATCVAYDVSEAALLSALRHTAAGGRLFLGPGGTCIARVNDLSRLTRRERDVYEHLVRGKRYADIALKLRIGYETVRTHSRRICEKLGVDHRFELVGTNLSVGEVLSLSPDDQMSTETIHESPQLWE